VRTEVHIGDLEGWLVGLIAAEDPPLLVLGTEATAAELETLLSTHLRALFQVGSPLPVLLTLAARRGPVVGASPAAAVGDYR
jgi:hypothetical protein